MSVPHHSTVASPPLSPLVPQRREQFQETPYQEKSEQAAGYVAEDLPHHRPRVSSPEEGEKLQIHPLSSIVFGAWTIFIMVVFWICEKAVAVSKTTVGPPWRYSTLPSLFLTVFAQAHSPITALHLGRLAVSSLHHPLTQPRSWAELFWLADGSWNTPLGMVSALKDRRALKTSLSYTIVAFSLTSLVALGTPIVLSHAYPVGTVSVPVAAAFVPKLFAPLAFGFIDTYVQMSVGFGGWVTGEPVESLYNASVYDPATPADGTGLFFSGDVGPYEARIPGLYLEGGCASLPPASFGSIVNTPEAFNTTFPTYCSSHGFDQGVKYGSTLRSNGAADATLSYCTTTDMFVGLFLENATDPAVVFSALVFLNTSTSSTAVSGLFNCTSSINAGIANVSGPLGTFWAQTPGTVNATGQGGEPGMHPLSAFLWNVATTVGTPYQYATGVDQGLGFLSTSSGVGDVFHQPDIAELAQRLWAGVTHTTAATMLLSQTQDTTYVGTQWVASTGRTRNSAFVRGAVALVVLWFALLVLATAAMGRRTFGNGLSSYVVARLFVGMGELVEGQSCGDLSKNIRLGAPFATVGDGTPHAEKGVIELGGRGPLRKDREFS